MLFLFLVNGVEQNLLNACQPANEHRRVLH